MLTVADRSGNGMGIGFVARAEAEDTFIANGNGTPARVLDTFNVSLRGTFSATFTLKRSYDNGLTYNSVTAGGTSITYTAPCEETYIEPEPGVLYRWECSSYASGTAYARISQ